jgi:transcriptional antiterminator NusG
MKRWYIVTTYSGYENSVKQDLERRRESMNMTHLIYQVLVPEEVKEVVDKKGKKKER